MNAKSFRLGIDLGSASLGWALVETDATGDPVGLVRAGVRVFDPGVSGTELDILRGKDESKAVERRQARLRRRQLRRRAGRQRDLFELLQSHGLMPPYAQPVAADRPHVWNAARSAARHEILNQLDASLRAKWKPRMSEVPAPDQVLPYFLRAAALQERLEPFELGRVFYHLAQRRGFKSNRRETAKTKEQEKEKSQVYEGISEIARAKGQKTLGEFFAHQNPHDQRIRKRWTARTMHEEEFEKIWAAQSPHHTAILTPELKNKIRRLLYHQRPIARQTHLIGTCELEPGRKRAPLACLDAQRFRLLQKVNDLRVRFADFTERKLTAGERDKLLHALETKGDLKFSAARTLLGLPKRGCWFNFEGKGQKDKLPGNRTATKMRAAFGERWDRLSAEERNAVVEDWRLAETEEWLVRRGIHRWGLEDKHARIWADASPEDGYASLSRRALAKLLPIMEEGFSFKEAEKEIYGARFSGGPVRDSLPPVRQAVPSLRNPAVERALTELRKVVNAIVRQYGKPDRIHIELARDLKNPRQRRKEIWKTNSERRDQREAMADRLLKEIGIRNPSRAQIEKALLWEECKGQCPYTGRKISFADLFSDQAQFDVEHILPFSRCPDDSFANKTLCYLPENRDLKRNRTPFEAYGADPQRWEEILNRVRQFNHRDKLRRFQVQTREELDQFSSRQLNDTRYASKLAAQYLAALYGGRDVADAAAGEKRKICATPGGLTAILRRNWQLEAILREPEPAATEEKAPKPRGDHRHHAIDAIVIALTTPAAVQALAESAESNAARGRVSFKGLKAPWPDFVESIRPHIEQMVVSHRPEHKLTGQLHDETLYGEPYLVKEEKKFTRYVHVRKPVDSLTAGELQDIVDPAVRAAVEKRLAELGDFKKLQTAGVEPPYLEGKNGKRIPIRRVRIRKALTTQPVGEGPRKRHVAPNNNHHMEIVAELDSRGEEVRWDGVPVSLLEAMERKRKGQPIVNRHHGPENEVRFKFSLMNGDTIEIPTGERAGLYVVRSVWSQGPLTLVRVNDARIQSEIRAAKQMWFPSADTLRELDCRKVVVNVLGKVHPAND